MTHTVLLKPRNPAPNIAAMSARPRRIRVLKETPRWWLGQPVSNPACPPLLWPKFAWEEALPCIPSA
jgi:hypothetical protein